MIVKIKDGDSMPMDAEYFLKWVKHQEKDIQAAIIDKNGDKIEIEIKTTKIKKQKTLIFKK